MTSKQHGSRFEQAVATREGAGAIRNEDLVENHRVLQDDEVTGESNEKVSGQVKGGVEHVERGSA